MTSESNKSDKIWYLFDEKAKLGPFGWLEIADLIKFQRVNEDTFAIRDGMDKKIKLGKIEEFEECFKVTKSDVAIEKENTHEKNSETEKSEEDGKPAKGYSGGLKATIVQEWFLVDGKSKKGPYSEERVREALKDENLSRSAYAFVIGADDRQRVLFVDNFKGNVKALEKEVRKIRKKDVRKKKKYAIKVDFRKIISPSAWAENFKDAFSLKDAVKVFTGVRNIGIVLLVMIFLLAGLLALSQFTVKTHGPGSGAPKRSSGKDVHKKGLLKKKIPPRNGLYTAFHKNSQLSEKSEYVNNILTGISTRWDKEGRKTEECNYRVGGIGKCQGWFESGKKKYEGQKISKVSVAGEPVSKRDGKWIFWREDGSLDRTIFYKNGKKLKVEKTEVRKIAGINIDYPVRAMVFGPRGRYLLIRSMKKVHVFDIKEKKEILGEKYDRGFKHHFFSPDGRFFVVKALSILRLYNLEKKRIFMKIKDETEILSADFSRNSRYLKVVVRTKLFLPDSAFSYIYRVKIYNLAEKKMAASIKLDGSVEYSEISSDGRYLIVGTRNWERMNVFLLFDMQKKKVLSKMKHGRSTKAARLSSDGKYVLIPHVNWLGIFRLSAGKTVAAAKHGGHIGDFELSMSGKHLLLIYPDMGKVYSIPGKKFVGALKHQGSIVSAGFISDSRSVVTASDEGNVKIFNIGKRKILVDLRLKFRIRNLYASPYGKYVVIKQGATGEGESAFFIYSTGNGKALAKFQFEFDVKLARFSPDGNFIVFLTHGGASDKEFLPGRVSYSAVGEIYSLEHRKVFAPRADKTVRRAVYFGEKVLLYADGSGRSVKIFSTSP